MLLKSAYETILMILINQASSAVVGSVSELNEVLYRTFPLLQLNLDEMTKQI